MHHRWMGLFVGALIGAMSGAVSGATAPATETEAQIAAQVATRLVRLPVLFEEKAPGACASLTGANLELKEDGQSVGAVHLESTRLETSHAVLIDTSGSMLDNLAAFRETVAAHVAELPADEPALLATFGDSLVLHAPFTTDRLRFKLGLDWIETGGGKNPWDATKQLVRYLRPLRGRKVLLLLTDGCDTQGVAAASAETVIDQARRSESVVVFAVGVGMPPYCPGTDIDPAKALSDLAQATGGEFRVLNRIGELDGIIAAFRRRLDREKVIQYEPRPFGEGPKDRPEERDHRSRKLELTVRGAPDCRGRLAGASTRYESSSDSFVNGRRGPAPENVPSFREVGGNRLQADVLDVVQDGGVSSNMIGLVLPGPVKPRVTKMRKVAAVIPSLGNVVRDDAGPETVMSNALDAVAGPPLGRHEPRLVGESPDWTDVPFLVNGRTLLDSRAGLARAMADDPEYGRWALVRVGTARLAELDRLIGQAATPETRGALKRARAALNQSSWTPEASELETHLGAWLGDVPAPEMFNAAETWLARRLLESVAGGHLERLDTGAAEAERLWELVTQWFPPAQDVRSIGLLLPGYDTERDLIGYYRVTLKQGTAYGINAAISGFDPTKFLQSEAGDTERSLYHRLQRWNYSRNAPLGARMVRWMLEQELVRPLLDPLAVKSIRYATNSNRDLYPVLDQLGIASPREGTRAYPARQVTVTLADRENPDEEFEVGAYFPTSPEKTNVYADAPGCVVLPKAMPREGRAFELFGALFASKKYSAFPCVFQEGAATPAESRPSGE